MRKVRLGGTNFKRADLRVAILDDTDLGGANLSLANLGGTRLRRASLIGAKLIRTNLSHSDLSRADLQYATFNEARLGGANLSNAVAGWTIFANVDLSNAEGLDSLYHVGPSTIGVDSISRSRGNIADSFLRGCGLPDEFFAYARARVKASRFIEFYSCFISYSSKDQEFAERLHVDLQAKGVRVWFAPHDLPIGAKIRLAIDKSIHLHDKLLLVLSKTSVSSQWVEQEVETALSREREQDGRVVLFPIRIDDAVMGSRAGWPALIKNSRNIGDFTRWRDQDSYQKVFDRLLKDLKAEA